MTADEVIFAGGTNGKAPNTYYSRNSNTYSSDETNVQVAKYNSGKASGFWTMSGGRSNSMYEYLMYVTPSGQLSYSNGNNSDGSYRPVLSLKYGTLVSGSGTVSDPYLIN